MPTPENLQIVGDIYSAEIIYKSRCAAKPLEKIILTTITFDLTLKSAFGSKMHPSVI